MMEMKQLSPRPKRENLFLFHQSTSTLPFLIRQNSHAKNVNTFDYEPIIKKQVSIESPSPLPTCRYQSTFSSPKITPKQEQVFSPLNNYKPPKISFSYNRKRAQGGEGVKCLPGSCRQIFKQAVGDLPVQQFSIATKKLTKVQKQQRLKLWSCILSTTFVPQEHILNHQKEKNSLFDHDAILTNSITEMGNISKVMSTETASSTIGRSSQELFQIQMGRQKEFLTFNSNRHLRKQSKSRLSLLDRISPSKLLKKTIVLSKFDFGGMFNRENYKSQNENTQNDTRSIANQSKKWENCMKCLFTDSDDNLKESIHCGPEIRIQRIENNYLVGFGREIEASCIPEHE